MYSHYARFFFRNTVKHISEQFPTIFNQEHEEDEDNEGTGKRYDKEARRDGLEQFNFFPLILLFCTETNTQLKDVWDFSINLVCYTLSYILVRNKKQQQEINKLRRKI